MKILSFFVAVICFISSYAFFYSPQKSPLFIGDPDIIVDPYHLNPLTAIIVFDTIRNTQITLTVKGKNGADDIVHTFQENTKHHEIPVLGLYANTLNEITLRAKAKTTEETKTLYIMTQKTLKRSLHFITKNKNKNPKYYFITDGFVIDEQGKIRYDFDGKGRMVYHLGNEIITESRINGLQRFSMIGKLEQTYPFPTDFISFTHGIGQKPNGNFLIPGTFTGTTALINGKEEPTHRDFIIELDYSTGETVKKWDLSERMNPNRSVIVEASQKDFGATDWCHMNGLSYDAEDNTILVSCRNSGIIKIDDKTGDLIWIVSPNTGFDKSGRKGNGPTISDKVLIATDRNGKAFSDAFQTGHEASSQFKWPTSNHNVRAYENGIFSVFDNSGPIYDKTIVTSENAIASVFQVSKDRKKIKQLWRENLDVYSAEGCSVFYDPNRNDLTVFLSRIHHPEQNGTSYGLLRRYDYKTHDILFEALIYRGGKAYYYYAEDFSFYP